MDGLLAMEPRPLVIALLVLVLVVVLAWQLSFSAARLDRLHARVEGARSALETQLVRRATASLDLANSGLLDPATALIVAGAASEALLAGEDLADEPGESLAGPEGYRETAESDLSRALQVALGDAEDVAALRQDPYGGELVGALAAVCHRAQLARRFHNDAVLQAQRVRHKRVVRWAHLSGRAQMPQTIEIDDDPPAPIAR